MSEPRIRARVTVNLVLTDKNDFAEDTMEELSQLSTKGLRELLTEEFGLNQSRVTVETFEADIKVEDA